MAPAPRRHPRSRAPTLWLRLRLAPSALLLLLLLPSALAKGELSPARRGEGEGEGEGEGSGLGALLRRLMLDLFAWLGSLFGLRSATADVHHLSHDDGDGRFPLRGPGRRASTASPQEVEVGFSADDGLHERGVAGGHPEFHDASPEAGNGGDASVEQLGGGGGGVGEGSPEELAGDRPDAPPPAPARVSA